MLQGLLSGPLLFLLCINDMPNCLQRYNHRLFAGGSMVYNTIRNPDTKILRHVLDCLVDRTNDWQTGFNANKWESMTINRTRLIPCQYFVTTGTPLAKTGSFKYLSVTIDNSITFEDHKNNITTKATGVLYMLMRSL